MVIKEILIRQSQTGFTALTRAARSRLWLPAAIRYDLLTGTIEVSIITG